MGKFLEACQAFADTFKRPPAPPVVGYSSPANLGGYVQDDTFEYVAKWQDRQERMKLIREMRMGHVDTAMLWHIPLICMTAAKPKVEVAQAEEGDKKLQDLYDQQAAFVEWNFLEDPCGMRDSWAQLLFEMSLFLPDGFSLFELDWRNHKEKQIDGLPVRYLHWAHWRSPDSIAPDGWKVDNKTGELIEVQQSPGWGTNQSTTPGPMKANNILLLTNRRIGNNFEGESIYRPVHKNYDMQFFNEKTECIVNERFSGLLDLSWDPAHVQADIRPAKDGKDYDIVVNGQVYSKMKTMLKGILVHKNNYTISGPFKLRMVTPEGKPVDVGPTIERHRNAIMRSGILHFMTLGSTPYGSYSVGDLQEHPFNNFINSCLNYIYGKWNKVVVRKLIDANWPHDESTLYPKMTAKFTREDLEKMSIVFKNMFEAGYPADSETYKHFARVFGWPEPQDNADESEAKAKTPGSTPGEGEKKEEPPQTRTEFQEWKPYRKLRPQEEHVAFADIVETLNRHREQLTKRLDKIRDKRIRWVQQHISGMNRKQLADPQIIKAEDLPFKDDMRKAAKGYLQNVINFGRQQVRSELRKLGKKVAAWEAFAEPFPWPVRNISSEGTTWYCFQEMDEDEFLDYLTTMLTIWAASTFIGSVLNNAKDQIATGASAAVVATFVTQKLTEASENVRAVEIGRYVNQAFGYGREEEFRKNQDSIEYYIRSGVMDDRICDHCESEDYSNTGKEYVVGSAEEKALILPDPLCEGQSRCRCVKIGR